MKGQNIIYLIKKPEDVDAFLATYVYPLSYCFQHLKISVIHGYF